jgi:hypothetical protein
MEKKDCNVIDLNKKKAIIERTFYYEGEKYTEVSVYDKIFDKTEYIGTSYDEMKYYFNKNYVVFVKDEDVEFAFDINNFCFISDEMEKMIAFNRILKSSQIEYTDAERKIKLNSDAKRIIKKLSENNK